MKDYYAREGRSVCGLERNGLRPRRRPEGSFRIKQRIRRRHPERRQQKRDGVLALIHSANVLVREVGPGVVGLIVGALERSTKRWRAACS
jgi:hypothetical protein